MSHPLSDQRTHSDLIAELYDRHAAGLFAYCFDQLGDKGTAADAVVAVLTSVPVMQPRRALLFALARREIARRDVVYFPPIVDFAVDPPTALIERVIRDLRPHQREVLLLASVCRLAPDELADVLDVAIDTAGQLIVSARNRFTQSLKTALYHARHAEYVPERVAEVYGALEVAPIEDVLARLPWQRPPADLRARLLAILPSLDPAGLTQPKTRLPVKQLWPTTPDWPLPLSDPDQTTSTSLIPVVSPPSLSTAGGDGKPKHEATTEPIPRLQGSILAAMAEAKAFRPWSRKQQSPAASEPPQDSPATPDKPKKPRRTHRADKTHRPDRTGTTHGKTEQRPPAISLSAPVPSDLLDPPTDPTTSPIPDEPAVPSPETAGTTEDTAADATPATDQTYEGPATEESPTGEVTPPAKRSRALPGAKRRWFIRSSTPSRHGKFKPLKRGEHHFDWAWELVGLLLAIAIALTVFFSMPMIVTP
ncbi:hypothetical protein AB0K60_27445 [Thermopolyspora sp. NPDC052614]|uniref:hypothetical protein n=1 Tax=Thermopolyspora sp. NPDC052614 TaxID=3155682 RepID=UPI0034251BB8